jgi:hypothetical protein
MSFVSEFARIQGMRDQGNVGKVNQAASIYALLRLCGADFVRSFQTVLQNEMTVN